MGSTSVNLSTQKNLWTGFESLHKIPAFHTDTVNMAEHGSEPRVDIVENHVSTSSEADLKSVLVTSVLNLEKLDTDLYR